jgi:hypothetical protein
MADNSCGVPEARKYHRCRHSDKAPQHWYTVRTRFPDPDGAIATARDHHCAAIRPTACDRVDLGGVAGERVVYRGAVG